MTDPRTFDHIALTVPPGATPAEALLMRAQTVIRAAFYSFGEPDVEAEQYSLGREELVQTLAFAIAMLLCDGSTRTRRALRQATGYVEKYIRTAAEDLQGGETLERMLTLLGMTVRRPH